MSGDFSYTIKFQRRKTLALHVLADGVVEVRAPLGMAERHIVRFVEERVDWVLRTRARQLDKHRWQEPVAPGAQVWYLGRPLRLEVGRGTPAVCCGEDSLQVLARDPLNLPALARQLDGWWRARADEVFRERLMAVVALFPDLAPPPLRLRKMRRRWGSCSRRGHVTLNTELIKLPLSLIDYVIAHELCHLYAFNHSPRFYRHLAAVMPDWKRLEQMLRQY